RFHEKSLPKEKGLHTLHNLHAPYAATGYVHRPRRGTFTPFTPAGLAWRPVGPAGLRAGGGMHGLVGAPAGPQEAQQAPHEPAAARPWALGDLVGARLRT